MPNRISMDGLVLRRNHPANPRSLAVRPTCAAYKQPEALFPFTMAFQPIIDIVEARIDSYEALVRGPAGEGAKHMLDQVSAGNTYAFDQACRVKAIELATRLGMQRRLCINFLPNAIYEPLACIKNTLDAAFRTGFRPDRLTLEIVETEVVSNTPHLMRIVSEYRRQGFKIALDDFATGYSGLARLADLKPDIVKLDRILVKNCHEDQVRLAIIASVISLGAELGIEVVVEGVENVKEFDAVRALGARFVQGFYLAEPMFENIVGDHGICWPAPVAMMA